MARKKSEDAGSKSVKNVKNSLKFKAQPKGNSITVRVGVKKYNVPVDARIISNNGYMFLSFPAVSELFRIEDKQLKPMANEEDATEAYSALNPGRKRNRRRSSGVELPAELEQMLKNLPPNFRIGYDAEGMPRLVKKRTRSKAGAE
jgi:hypothetical protein